MQQIPQNIKYLIKLTIKRVLHTEMKMSIIVKKYILLKFIKNQISFIDFIYVY